MVSSWFEVLTPRPRAYKTVRLTCPAVMFCDRTCEDQKTRHGCCRPNREPSDLHIMQGFHNLEPFPLHCLLHLETASVPPVDPPHLHASLNCHQTGLRAVGQQTHRCIVYSGCIQSVHEAPSLFISKSN